MNRYGEKLETNVVQSLPVTEIFCPLDDVKDEKLEIFTVPGIF
jgi:hypothetical protein